MGRGLGGRGGREALEERIMPPLSPWGLQDL